MANDWLPSTEWSEGVVHKSSHRKAPLESPRLAGRASLSGHQLNSILIRVVKKLGKSGSRLDRGSLARVGELSISVIAGWLP